MLEKLVFEIAVDQQTKARDQTFEWVADSKRPPVPAVQPCPYLIYFCHNYANLPKLDQNLAYGCSTYNNWSPTHKKSYRLDKNG